MGKNAKELIATVPIAYCLLPIAWRRLPKHTITNGRIEKK